ncbi:MAG: zinc ribbon domain-containing protein [Euryarchaeota archaeon]|nr:zinc ribbon domain-containing protein [Euryarchaeota archaeon]
MPGKMRCPVCGTQNEEEATSCVKCRTSLSKKGKRIEVSAPKEEKVAEKLNIDIGDPATLRVLEELMMIPGMTRAGAVVLYKNGVRGVEDFVSKAMSGDRKAGSMGRVIANKIILSQVKKGGKRERLVKCPSCNSPVKASLKKCGVCGAEVDVDIAAVDLAKAGERLSEAVKETLGDFSADQDFASLPDDMKAQIISALSSDEEISEAEAKRLAETVLNLPEEFSGLVDDITGMGLDTPDAPKAAKRDQQKEKRTKIIMARLGKWRSMGYDVSELEPLAQGDFEVFKTKAKEILAKQKPKVPSDAPSDPTKAPAEPRPFAPRPGQASAGEEMRARFRQQIGVWKEKGFNVEGLEEALDRDVEEFKRLSVAMLKASKEKR